MFELPAGEVRAAAGYQSRRNSGVFNPDILQSQQSFTDQVIGVYPTGYLDAETSVDDYYVEGLIPVIQGKTAFQRLELEIGARYSDYEHTDAENTWKTMINWQVNDILRFRGGFNRATRAPNLGELFLNPQEIFTGGRRVRRCLRRALELALRRRRHGNRSRDRPWRGADCTPARGRPNGGGCDKAPG